MTAPSKTEDCHGRNIASAAPATRSPQLCRFPSALCLPSVAAGAGRRVRLVCQRGARHNRPLPGPREDDLARLGEYPSNVVAAPTAPLGDILAHPDLIPSHHHPRLGRPAPEFELTDAEGKAWNLKGLRAGGPVVVIFYQGYSCVHCVRQLFDVNKDLPVFLRGFSTGGRPQRRPSGFDQAAV